MKLGAAVEVLSPEQQRLMEPVLVSQCFHGIPALCGAHHHSDTRGQIAVLVDCKAWTTGGGLAASPVHHFLSSSQLDWSPVVPWCRCVPPVTTLKLSPSSEVLKLS